MMRTKPKKSLHRNPGNSTESHGQPRPLKARRVLSLGLSLLITLGNPSAWLFSLPLRFALPAFMASFFLSTKSFARSMMNGSPKTYPVVDRRSPHLSGSPSDTDLADFKLLGEPFYPTSNEPQDGENPALAQAIQHDLSPEALANGEEDFPQLHSFTLSHPGSRWILSVELNRGLNLIPRGYYSEALEAFRTAWEAGKDENATSDPQVKSQADLALGELVRLEAGFGQVDGLEKVVGALEARHPSGKTVQCLLEAKDTLATVDKRPDRAYLCGPEALKDISLFEHQKNTDESVFMDAKSGPNGFSLEELSGMSKELGLGLTPAKIQPGSVIPVPSVVHWKLGHFAAILEEKNSPANPGQSTHYHLKDPVLGKDIWVSAKALQSESSGYFLVPAGSPGFTVLAASEASTVWGRGFVQGNPPQPPPQSYPGAPFQYNDGGDGSSDGIDVYKSGGCSDCSGGGQGPQASLDVNLVASMIVDTPLTYQPAVGPSVQMRLTYCSKTADQLPFANFGSNWSFNWQAFVQYDIDTSTPANPSNYIVIPRDGGEDPFVPNGPSSFTFSNMQVYTVFDANQGNVAGLPSAFIRTLPTGWTEVYGLPVVNNKNVQILLTAVVDPQGNYVTLTYDPSTNLLLYLTDATGKVTTFNYGPGGEIASIQNPNHQNAYFGYTNGHLFSILDETHNTTTFTYGGNSALSNDWVDGMITPDGTTSFDYAGSDTNGTHELEITDPAGLKRHARFTQPQAPPDGITQAPPAGGIGADQYMDERNTFYWDRQAMAQAPLSPNSAQIYHFFHDILEQSAVLECYKNPLMSRIWYIYPGQPSEHDIPGATQYLPIVISSLTDTGFGQAVAFSQYSYNSYGNETRYTDPTGRQFNYTYAANGIDLTQVTDSRGDALKTLQYNSQHEPTQVTDGSGQKWAYTYNGFGQPTGSTAPMGEQTTYTYDASNQLSSVVPPQVGGTVNFSYDSFGRVQSVSNAALGTRIYNYDDSDRVTSIDYPDGTSKNLTYTNWNLTSSQDRLLQTTSFMYDSDQRLISVMDPKNQTTRYGWSPGGGISELIDPAGNPTLYNRDLGGRVVQKILADGSQYGYSYGSNGGMLQQASDPQGQVTQYSRQVDGRLASVSYQDTQNPTPGVTYQYDPVLGRLSSMTDGTGTTSYNYNPIGQKGGGLLRSITSPVGQTTSDTAYAYDANDRIIQRAIDGIGENYGYNSQGQLANITNPLGSFTNTYDPNTARLVQVANNTNGQMTQYSYYDPADPNGATGRLKSIQNMSSGGQVISGFSYAYDPLGRITQMGQVMGSTMSNNYAIGYDPANQLQAVTLKSGTGGYDGLAAGQAVSYTYDSAGNRTAETAPGYQNKFGTPDNLNQLTTVSPNPLSMSLQTDDTSGETAQVNGQAAPLSSNGTVNVAVPPSAGTSTVAQVVLTEPNGGTTMVPVTMLNTQPVNYDPSGNTASDNQYGYMSDGANRLLVVNNANGMPSGTSDTLSMQYDGMGRRVGIAALNAGGAVTALNQLSGATTVSAKTYVWAGNQMVEERDATGKTVLKRFYGAGEQDSGQNLYYTRDHLGSIRDVSDSSGNVQAQFDYDPWGRQTQVVGTMQPSFGYTGHFQEQTTGLTMSKYRVYNPELGRWISGDPTGQQAGPNVYGYCGNNPMSRVDPLGTDWVDYFDWVTPNVVNGAEAVAIGTTIVALTIATAGFAGGAVAAAGGTAEAAATGGLALSAAGAARGGVTGAIYGAGAAFNAGGSTGDVVKGAAWGLATGAAVGAFDPSGIGASASAKAVGNVVGQIGKTGKIDPAQVVGAYVTGAAQGAVGLVAPADPAWAKFALQLSMGTLGTFLGSVPKPSMGQ